MSSALASTVLFLAFLFAQSAPNLAGTWKFDPLASTGQPAAKGASLLVITQSGDALTFDYYSANRGERGELIQSSVYTADGRDHPGNKIRTYVTYVKAYWQGKSLIAQTRNIMDPEGYQSFTIEDRWTLSNDGKTLTDQTSDGTKVVYTRQPDATP
jgi:hypothetical protein